MTTLKNATIGATVFSVTTLLLCLVSVSHIYNEMKDAWMELDNEMITFKAQTDDLWNDMLRLGAGTPSNRQRRQYNGYAATGSNSYGGGVARSHIGDGGDNPSISPDGIISPSLNPILSGFQASGDSSSAGRGFGVSCICIIENKCQPGEPGPQGEKGVDGLPGLDGKNGLNGVDAQDMKNSQTMGCFYCPPGLPGPQGPLGAPGVRGMRGAAGHPGNPGRDGQPGQPGEMGPPGNEGEQGTPGRPGGKGADGQKPVGLKGLRGQRGDVGAEGEPGVKGKNALSGPPGAEGDAGSQGATGTPGQPGEEGAVGTTGKPGEDSEYCPCPDRLAESHNFGSNTLPFRRRHA